MCVVRECDSVEGEGTVWRERDPFNTLWRRVWVRD